MEKLLAHHGVKVSARAINKWRNDPAYRQACSQLRPRLPLAVPPNKDEN
jgi:hypothetical protein